MSTPPGLLNLETILRDLPPESEFEDLDSDTAHEWIEKLDQVSHDCARNL
jgi:hypothetical protein